ncbi:MAG: sulfotransferase [Paracoccaceae bacterium]
MQAPKFVDALLLLTEVLRDQGERDMALARLRDAAEASGANPGVWRMLVNELLRSGQKSRARKLAAKAPLRPADRKALLELAQQSRSEDRAAILGGAGPDDVSSVRRLIETGKAGQARVLADALLASHPTSAALWNLRGIASLAEQAPDRAAHYFTQALRQAPDYAEALANLGLAFALLGRAPDAASTLARALSLAPENLEARINLSNALLELDRAGEALDEVDRALVSSPSNPAAIAVKANTLIALRRFTEALDLLRAAASRDGDRFGLSHLLVSVLSETDGAEAAIAYADSLPDPTPETLHDTAMLKAELGRIDEARDDFRTLARRHPGFVLAYRDFGLITKWTAEEPLLPLLLQQVEAGGPIRLQDKAALNYALGKARMDTGDMKGAFEAYRRANEAQDTQLPPAKRQPRQWEQEIAKEFTAERIAEFAAAGTDTIAPIFIVGMPRSGSTLTEQVLAAHPDLAALGEHSVVTPGFFRSERPDLADIAAAARSAAEALKQVTGPGKRPVDKHLHNFLVVGLLAAAFPKARFLHTMRDPRDNCLSIYFNALDPVKHPYSVHLERLAEFYVRYRRLMDHWRDVVGDRILDLRYEDLVADPGPRIRAMIGWLGLPWNDACLRPEEVNRRVQTISVGQVRKGITTGSVARWKPFAEELRPLTAILEREGVLS